MKVKSGLVAYLALVIIPGMCYGFYAGGWLVLQVYASVTLTNFWLSLPVILLPYMALAWLLRGWKTSSPRNERWSSLFGIAMVVSIVSIMVAYIQMSQLVTIPEGIRSGHKDSLFWGTVFTLYIAASVAGYVVLVLPQKPTRP